MFDALAENLVQTQDKNDEMQPKRMKTEDTATVSAPSMQEPTFDLGLAELRTIDKSDLNDIFTESSEIESPDILDIITQIEQENKEVEQNQQDKQVVPSTTCGKTINVSNIQNVQQMIPANLLPNMIFPHSNVTINYHIHQ